LPKPPARATDRCEMATGRRKKGILRIVAAIKPNPERSAGPRPRRSRLRDCNFRL
jgi:hypothetical protein